MTWSGLLAALHEVAPDLVPQPAKGATGEDLDRLESVIGRKLPESFRRTWGEHDGMRGHIFVLLDFLDTKTIAGEWRLLRDYDGSSGGLEAVTTGPVKPHWTSRDWIPFVLIGGSTDHFCLDLDPAPGGTVGQVIHASPKDDRRRVLAPDVPAFLDLLASMVRDGRARRDEDELDVFEALEA